MCDKGTMLLRFLLNLFTILVAPLLWLRRTLMRRRARWVHLRLDRRVAELPPVEPPWRRWLRWSAPDVITLADLKRLGDALAEDPNVRGVLVEVPHNLRGGWSALVGVRSELARMRGMGKHVVAYLPDGGGTSEIYVALAASKIWIAPEATLTFLGVASQSMYLKPLLDRLGVGVEVHAAGRFKTAAEPLTAHEMSEPQREQRQALLNALHAELLAAIRASNRLDDAGIDQLFVRGFLRGADAVQHRVADDVCYRDQLIERLTTLDPSADPKRPLRLVPDAQYVRLALFKLWRPLLPQPYVAVIPVRGAIGLDGSAQGGANVPALTTAIDAVRRDPRALAAVLYVDSPGGSALASDHIHREVQRLAGEKPVVACFGDVAASGGYYVAAPARRIIAQPTTVTGSIGVISAKLVLGGLLERLGVRPQTLKTTIHSDMLSATRGFTDDEHAIMEREAQGMYRTFLGVVAQGRNRPVEEIEALASGRVWSGVDALKHGLIDRLGGLQVALDEARALVDGLTATQRIALEPRVVTSFARRRPAPRASKPEAMAFAWLKGWSPELATFIQAEARGERLLMLAPWLSKR